MDNLKNSINKLPDRFSENVAGDFYVEYNVCTACGAPQGEAPDLIDHSKLEYGHCYFKKQPKTDDEIERAINAIAVSCVSGLRYGGTDEKILKRLYEIGEAAQCDNLPKGNYKPILWGKVTFHYNKSIKILFDLLTTQLVVRQLYVNKQILNHKLEDNYFEFTNRWADRLSGQIFTCHAIGDNKYKVEIQIEKNGYEISIRGSSIILNAILCSHENVSEIEWLDEDNLTYTAKDLR